MYAAGTAGAVSRAAGTAVFLGVHAYVGADGPVDFVHKVGETVLRLHHLFKYGVFHKLRLYIVYLLGDGCLLYTSDAAQFCRFFDYH